MRSTIVLLCIAEVYIIYRQFECCLPRTLRGRLKSSPMMRVFVFHLLHVFFYKQSSIAPIPYLFLMFKFAMLLSRTWFYSRSQKIFATNCQCEITGDELHIRADSLVGLPSPYQSPISIRGSMISPSSLLVHPSSNLPRGVVRSVK